MNRTSIIGIKGIPAKYGGFETLAEYLTFHLGKANQLVIYCTKKPFSNKGVRYHNNSRLIYIPVKANGPQSIIYDSLALFHAMWFSSTLLVLGVSGAIFFPLAKKFSKINLIVNIDGIEHRREKWKILARVYLKWAEKTAVKYADIIISDNEGIKDYVKKKYKKESVLIPYGGDHVHYEKLSPAIKNKYSIPDKYAFKVCRIEPENNIGMLLDAFTGFDIYPLVIVGNWMDSDYGEKLYKNYQANKNLVLLEPIYNQQELNQIRSNCFVYIHGHSAGGTNPSLVEAMHLKLPVIAYDVIFNRHTTNQKALFFKTKEELIFHLNHLSDDKRNEISRELHDYAQKNYTWEIVSQQYEQLF